MLLEECTYILHSIERSNHRWVFVPGVVHSILFKSMVKHNYTVKVGYKPLFLTSGPFYYSGKIRGKRLFWITEEHPLEIRTKKLNARLGLQRNEAVFFQIKAKNEPTDGATMPFPVNHLADGDEDWLLLAGIIHDELWGQGFIDAWVINLDTLTITKKLGTILVSKREGNEIMYEKMNSFYAPIIKKHTIYQGLELIRKIKKEE